MSHAKASANPNDFILPDLGEGVHEAELLKWRVNVGDTVEEHQILADMETDKAVVEVPSPRAGTISALHGAEGEILKVGNALVSYVPAAGSKPVPSEPPAAAGGQSSKQGRAPDPKTSNAESKAKGADDMTSQIAANVPGASSRGGPPASAGGSEGMNNGAHREDAGTVVGAMSGELGGISAAPGKALATPAVRRLARDLGVEIDTLAGSGLAGRVTEKDVRAAASGASRGSSSAAQRQSPAAGSTSPSPSTRVAPPTPRQPASRADQDLYASISAERAAKAEAPARAASVGAWPTGDTTRIPFRGVRRTIANRLRESVSTAVHFTVMDEADVSALDGLRKRLAAASGEKVSFLPFVASAVCRCLAGEFGAFNATTDDAAEEIVRHRAVHLGIATDTDNGLMVPVIRDCDKLGVLEIGRHIAHVAEAARTRTASREMLMGSTFTISNVGSHAGRFATPIINYPECGILAVGRARDGVVVRNGGIAVGKLLPLSLACDHRVVDGAQAALMLARLVEMLQSPEQLLGPARG